MTPGKCRGLAKAYESTSIERGIALRIELGPVDFGSAWGFDADQHDKALKYLRMAGSLDRAE